jgi:hypothetical protein
VVLDDQDAQTHAHVVEAFGIGHRPMSATPRDDTCSPPAGAPWVCDP